MTSASLGQEDFVNLPYQAKGQWKTAAHSPKAMVQGSDVVGHFLHIVQRNPWSLCILVEQQVRQRGLGSLDLRGEYGLLPYIGVQKELEVGQADVIPSRRPMAWFASARMAWSEVRSRSFGLGGRGGGRKARTFCPETVEVT
jgi:hypothetical protein